MFSSILPGKIGGKLEWGVIIKVIQRKYTYDVLDFAIPDNKEETNGDSS